MFDDYMYFPSSFPLWGQLVLVVAVLILLFVCAWLRDGQVLAGCLAKPSSESLLYTNDARVLVPWWYRKSYEAKEHRFSSDDRIERLFILGW